MSFAETPQGRTIEAKARVAEAIHGRPHAETPAVREQFSAYPDALEGPLTAKPRPAIRQELGSAQGSWGLQLDAIQIPLAEDIVQLAAEGVRVGRHGAGQRSNTDGQGECVAHIPALLRPQPGARSPDTWTGRVLCLVGC